MNVIPIRKRRKAEINIVPLVDVLVVLIFFFLVSMQFRNLTILNLTLPEIETAGEEKLIDSIEIGITIEGAILLNGTKVSDEEFRSQINQISQNYGELPVLIMADENSLLNRVTFVMDSCRKAGLERIRLQSR